MQFRDSYQQALANHGYQADRAQLQAVDALDALAVALQQRRWRWPWQRPQAVTGLYLHGDVGRGKTFVVDLFCRHINAPWCQRLHFHHFMQQVHQELAACKQLADPLATVAKRLAGRYRLICLDELYVSDIADAMILERLLRALNQLGVSWVFTSNLAPDQLYQGGLHRDRFLPAIALLKSITRVVHLDGGQDYRLRTLTRAAIHLVAEADGDARLEALAVELAPEPPLRDQQLTVCERPLPCRLVADDLVWFDFAILCRSARSQLDYIELARRFHTVLVSDVPQLGSDDDDAARRFIALVDEFYDRGVKLVMTQAVATADLYQGERLAFAFARCVSRLTEMQSESYLARPHTPA